MAFLPSWVVLERSLRLLSVKKKPRLETAMTNKQLKIIQSDQSRNLIVVLTMIAGMIFIPASVYAERIFNPKSVTAEQVIKQDVFLTGSNPSIEGTVNGDVFVVGSEAAIMGDVNGSVFVLAEKLELSGTVAGNLYVAAVEVNQTAEGQVERSLYALAINLMTEQGSTIGRDLNLVAMSARLQGQTADNTVAIIGPWEIFKVLREFFNQTITGFNPNPNPYSVARLETETIPVRTGSPHLASIRVEEVPEEPSQLAQWALDVLKSLFNFIVVGGLVLWIFPRRFKIWSSKVSSEPLASAGYGILVLINGYLVPVVGLVLVIGLLIGLLFLSLPSLAWTFFGLGMGVLITVFTLFQAVITFISKAIVAYMIGSLILSRFAPGVLKYAFLPLLLGFLIYVPLASIPYLGFVIGLVVTLLGLGAIWLGRKKAVQPEIESSEVD
jgi:cytoskeletal protein CcmA (bactofilin family)